MASEYKLELKGVSKSFPGVKALDNVQLAVRPGTVHALMGENGAGKSTLMNILTGLFPATTGTILIDNQEVAFPNPQIAEEAGLSFIHQEMNTWPEMTVLENLFLGRELKTPIGFLDQKAMKLKAQAVLTV